MSNKNDAITPAYAFLAKTCGVLLALFMAIFLCLVIFAIYVYSIADATEPIIQNTSIATQERVVCDTNLYTFNHSWLRKNSYGLYEMYLQGNGFERCRAGKPASI